MNAFLTKLVGKLPAKLQGVAKALVPSGVAVGAVAAEALTSGTFSVTELVTAGLGAMAAVITYVVPNLPPAIQEAVETVATDIKDAATAPADVATASA